MSDSVTNVQIEDVLSSIRKLVSEEVRAQTRDGVRGDPHATPAASEDRLILTPSLRVAPVADAPDAAPVHFEDLSADQAEDEPVAGFVHAEPPHEEADLLDLMARVRAAGTRSGGGEIKRPAGIKPVDRPAPAAPPAEEPETAVASALSTLETALRNGSFGQTVGPAVTDVDDQDSDFVTDLNADIARKALSGLDADEHDHSDQTETDLEGAGEDDLIASGLDDALDTEIVQPEPDDAASEGMEADVVPTFLRRSGVASLGQRIAEVEAVVTTHGGEWEPEADEPTDAAPEPAFDPLPWEDAGENDEVLAPEDSQTEVDVAAEAYAESDADDEMWEVEPDGKADFHAAAIAPAFRPHLRSVPEPETAQQREPETTDRDDADDAAAPTQAETDDWESARTESDYLTMDADRQTLTEEPALLDEEMLRDLVAEIVREELQGALGERITRNVRKLVRREIQRALTSQEIL
ncbi:hypothetical protein GCM10011360_21380 [Primorskyibacter flagellatus]|uniref:DUF2497 domain-containing protein n=1 Tax=Primorskyibacter flagellatus TaxID=1387277 RepID=A0A917A7G1_9RHOB|nr:hypothetical protein [Primorskyibacter flagellatus]GGE33262.1 hypothetical protein GCM10011360_21380 [Primorskyibacter flagellatus]